MNRLAVAGSGGRGAQAHAIPELIAKLEGAAAGSRELDAALCALIGHMPDGFTYELCEGFRYEVRVHDDERRLARWIVGAGYEREDIIRHAPPVTTSVDLILALIERELPGWIVRLDIRPHDAPGGEASLEAPWDGAHEHLPIWFEARAKTPALAACIAFLKALPDQPRAPQEDRSGRVMNPDLISKEGGEHG